MDGKTNGGVYNPKNLGLYTYTANNPVNLVDPDGNAAASPSRSRGPIGLIVNFMQKGHDIFEGIAIDLIYGSSSLMQSTDGKLDNKSDSKAAAPTNQEVRDKLKDHGLEKSDTQPEGKKHEGYDGTEQQIEDFIEDLTQGLDKETKETKNGSLDVYSDKDGGRITVRGKENSSSGTHKTVDTFRPGGGKSAEFKLNKTD